MQTAPTISALKARLDRYFWANASPEMARLQAALAVNFHAFDRIAVIGGLVRDFAHRGRSGFRSDADLVIDGPAGEVARLAERVGAAANKFGGYGFEDGPWKIDFWALEATWGRRYVPVQRLEDVIACTFFDWDAVAYDFRSRKLICGEGYLERIKQRRMDINLRPTPSPEGNLLRAIRRIMLWRLRAGPQMWEFIEETLDDTMLQIIQAKEHGMSGCQVSVRWESAAEARKALSGAYAGDHDDIWFY